MTTLHVCHIKIDFFWPHLMLFMTNSTFLSTPHVSHIKCDFHDHTSCHVHVNFDIPLVSHVKCEFVDHTSCHNHVNFDTPHVSHVKCDFLAHPSCQLYQFWLSLITPHATRLITLFLALSHTLLCFFYFSPVASGLRMIQFFFILFVATLPHVIACCYTAVLRSAFVVTI